VNAYQWPSRGKQIDLVVTDRQGRRLAVEADGGQHHRTSTGDFIPEDLERQALLEEAGWSFCTPFPHFSGVVSVPHRVRAGAGQGLLV